MDHICAFALIGSLGWFLMHDMQDRAAIGEGLRGARYHQAVVEFQHRTPASSLRGPA